jgi:hypothetical protein
MLGNRRITHHTPFPAINTDYDFDASFLILKQIKHKESNT